MSRISQEAMSLCDILVMMKSTKRMLTNKFNMKDLGVVDAIQEIKIFITSDGPLVSIT